MTSPTSREMLDDAVLEPAVPIRFRCAYCDQLLAIATRKVGTVVRCPKCAGQVIVPNFDSGKGSKEGPPQPAGNLFEQSDFGRELEPSQLRRPAAPAPKPAVPFATAPGPSETAVQDFDVEPVMLPGSGVFLTPVLLAVLGAGVVLLVGAAFFVGFLIGRG